MADATWSLDLALSGTAESKEAADQMERLRASVSKSTAELAKMRQAYSGLKIGGQQNTVMGKALKDQIDKTRKSIGQQTAEGLKMKGWLSAATKETGKLSNEQKRATNVLGQFAAGASLGGGPVAQLTAKASALSGAIGKAGLVGAALAGVVAIVALDAAIIKATLSVAKFAVTTADAYRSENLSLQGMTKAWYSMWFTAIRPGNANQIQQSIDEVSASVSIGREKVLQYAQELYRSRLRGENLKQALLGVSLAASAAGEEYAGTAKAMIIGNAMFGRSVTGAVNLFKSRFGDIVNKQMLALPTQINKARENFAALFRGLNITPLLQGLRSALKFLDQGTVGFEAWKTIFSTLFNPIFGGVKNAGDLMEHFLNRVTILTLDAQYAWIKMGGTVRLSSFGVKNFGDLLKKAIGFSSSVAVMLLRGGQAALMVAEVLGNVLSIFKGIYHYAAGTVKAIGAVFGASSGGAVIDEFKSAGDTFADMMKPDMMTSGTQMMQGIIDGIKSSTPALVGAVGQAMDAANNEVKKKQDMHSPSRVWKGFARNMAKGATDEFKAQTPGFASAAGAMANVKPMAPAPMQGGSTVNNNQRSQSNTVHLHLPPGASQSDMVTIPLHELGRLLCQYMEGQAVMRGAPI